MASKHAIKTKSISTVLLDSYTPTLFSKPLYLLASSLISLIVIFLISSFEDDEGIDELELIKDEVVLPLLDVEDDNSSFDVELVSLMLEEKEVLELLVLKELTLVNPQEHNSNDSNMNLNFLTLILL